MKDCYESIDRHCRMYEPVSVDVEQCKNAVDCLYRDFILSQYGSMEAYREHLGELEAKIREIAIDCGD